MSYSRLEQLPWIDVPPYDQLLTDLVALCQKRATDLICVQGPNGSGKSRVLTELLSSLSFDKTASLIALSGQENEVFYHNVQISPGLLDLQNSKFLYNFLLTIEAILKDKQHFYILIDDAEALSCELLQGMIQVIASHEVFKAQVTLVVFIGMTTIPIDLKRLLHHADIITLLPMSVMQAKQFVDSAYQCMQVRQEVSISSINRMHNLSYGYVGRIIKLLEHEEVSTSKALLFRRKYFKLLTLCSIFIIACIIVMIYASSGLTTDKTIDMVKPEGKQPEHSVAIMNPVEAEKEKVPVKVILPIQNAAEYDAMNELIEVKRVEPESIVQQLLASEVQKQNADQSIIEGIIQLTSKSIESVGPMQPASNHQDAGQTDGEKSYIIELARKRNKRELEDLLKGRSIPGKAQFKLINDNGTQVWVAYIGPYRNKKQAEQGQKKLPASLQRLSLKVNKEF